MYIYKKIRGIDGMGFGDVKLFAVLGIWFGWQGCLIILFLSSFLGSVFGMMGILNNKFSMQKQLPFAPFIVVASAIYYFNKQLIFNLLLFCFYQNDIIFRLLDEISESVFRFCRNNYNTS